MRSAEVGDFEGGWGIGEGVEGFLVGIFGGAFWLVGEGWRKA